MNINPCLLMPQNWVIAFHRKCLASTILIELFFLFALALASFRFKIAQSQKEEAQIKRKEDNVVIIEIMQKNNMEDKSIMPFRYKEKHLYTRSNTTLISKQNQLSNTIKAQVIQYSSKPEEQSKPAIQLKNLVLYEKDMKTIIGIELGNQFICIAIAMMYFPFALTTLVCCIQMFLFIIHYLLRICSDTCLAKFTKGGLLLLNIPIMAFSIYGLCTNIPQLHNSCFEL